MGYNTARVPVEFETLKGVFLIDLEGENRCQKPHGD